MGKPFAVKATPSGDKSSDGRKPDASPQMDPVVEECAVHSETIKWPAAQPLDPRAARTQKPFRVK
jgi:hypothetical protein